MRKIKLFLFFIIITLKSYAISNITTDYDGNFSADAYQNFYLFGDSQYKDIIYYVPINGYMYAPGEYDYEKNSPFAKFYPSFSYDTEGTVDYFRVNGRLMMNLDRKAFTSLYKEAHSQNKRLLPLEVTGARVGVEFSDTLLLADSDISYCTFSQTANIHAIDKDNCNPPKTEPSNLILGSIEYLKFHLYPTWSHLNPTVAKIHVPTNSNVWKVLLFEVSLLNELAHDFYRDLSDSLQGNSILRFFLEWQVAMNTGKNIFVKTLYSTDCVKINKKSQLIWNSDDPSCTSMLFSPDSAPLSFLYGPSSEEGFAKIRSGEFFIRNNISVADYMLGEYDGPRCLFAPNVSPDMLFNNICYIYQPLGWTNGLK